MIIPWLIYFLISPEISEERKKVDDEQEEFFPAKVDADEEEPMEPAEEERSGKNITNTKLSKENKKYKIRHLCMLKISNSYS